MNNRKKKHVISKTLRVPAELDDAFEEIRLAFADSKLTQVYNKALLAGLDLFQKDSKKFIESAQSGQNYLNSMHGVNYANAN